MKQLTYIFLLTLVLVGCGSASDRFKIEGRLRNMNQGEFYVYSLDGSINGRDTIKVDRGRLAYELQCTKPTTLVVVFPNFSEQPVFAEPGKTVELKADASHLKELEVTGTAENKLMNKFRQQIATASPPETVKFAAQFIKDHPQSAVSVYLLRRYFIASANPDYGQAATLVKILRKEQPQNPTLELYDKHLKNLSQVVIGKSLPRFSAKDVSGKTVTNAALAGKVGVVTVWATWNYDSQNFQRQLKQMQKNSNGKLKVVSVCIDANPKLCKNTVERDSVPFPTICDGNMLDTPLLHTLALYDIPDNILLQNGKVVARGLRVNELKERLEKLIN